MRHTFTTIITKEGKWFVARSAEFGVVSQGKTLQKAQDNLIEAVELYLENEPRIRKSISKQSAWVTTFELEYV